MMLDAAALNEECRRANLRWRVRVEAELTSTSDVLREEAVNGAAHGEVLFAEKQTAGRGRRDNRWVTPAGKDLMFSLLLRPDQEMRLWSRVTTLTALAICRAVERELPLEPRIKWPNDIYIGERKVAGLLAETVMTGQGMALVLGIGLNVNAREFPLDLADSATSLLLELSASSVRELDRQSLALTLLEELQAQWQRLEEGFAEVVAGVRERSWLLGKQIRAHVEGREIFGRAIDLNADGHLLVALADGSIRVLASAEGVRQVIS